MKYCLIIFFLFPILVKAQDATLPVTRFAEGQYAGFTADNLGNLYLLTQENRLKKLNVKGDSMGVFNDVRRYGKLSDINATNPLRTVLYYKDFRTIVVLDRLMNTVNTIDLRKQDLFQVRTIAPSYDNLIWVFDEQESKLKKIDNEGKLLSQTADLRLVLQDAPIPLKMFDQNGYVYMYDPEKGMYIFDYYGAMKNKIALLNWQFIQVLGNSILGIKDGKLLNYTTGTLDIKETLLPPGFSKYKDVLIAPQGVYVLEPTGVKLYSFTGY